MLSSGNVEDYSDGPNTSGSFSTDFGGGGHAGLTSLSGYTTYDAVSFSFDFSATQDTISYDFIFGSDEYPEYVGSRYNDSFGAWLTDPSGTKTQLSFDHGGNPITVNTAWMSESTGTELDGTTGVLPLRTTATVAKGQDYSIEFALADASDHIYDSTVYLSNLVGAGDPIDIYGLFVGVRKFEEKTDKETNEQYVVDFRGDNNPNDDGDLEKLLTNISFFAPCAEDQTTYFDEFGFTPLIRALVDAFSIDPSGYLFAADGYSDLTFDELTSWVKKYGTDMDDSVMYELDFGDPVLFTSDMWSPVSFASNDFTGNLLGYSGFLADPNPSTDVIPAPGALVLGSIGVGLVGWLRRRRNCKLSEHEIEKGCECLLAALFVCLQIKPCKLYNLRLKLNQ